MSHPWCYSYTRTRHRQVVGTRTLQKQHQYTCGQKFYGHYSFSTNIIVLSHPWRYLKHKNKTPGSSMHTYATKEHQYSQIQKFYVHYSFSTNITVLCEPYALCSVARHLTNPETWKAAGSEDVGLKQHDKTQ